MDRVPGEGALPSFQLGHVTTPLGFPTAFHHPTSGMWLAHRTLAHEGLGALFGATELVVGPFFGDVEPKALHWLDPA